MTPEQLKLLQQLAELGDVFIVKRGKTNLMKAISSKKENEEKKWLNSIIKDIKRELGIKTTNSIIEEIDFYKEFRT